MFSEEEVLKLVDNALDLCFKKFGEGKYPDAEVIAKQALKVSPDQPRALQLIGLIRHNQKDFEKAIEYFQKALELEPDNAENHNNISLCYSNLGRFNKSISHMQKAIELSPNCYYMHANLGLQYRQNQQTEEAMKSFRKSLDLQEDAHTWGMLGGCHGERHELDEAEACFKRAIELDPKFGGAHVDLASIYQLKGEWEKAWPEYEWRFEVYEQTKFWHRLYEPEKKWDGKQSLKGKTILLHAEQGTGDMIHFFRYVPLVKALEARIVVHCWESLASLFRPHVDEIYTTDPSQIPVYWQRDEGFEIPQYDFHASVVSLPYLLQNPPIPGTPYLSTSKRINTDDYSDYFKIGIVWAGNPQHPNDPLRSCRLARFRPIHDLPGVKLFSLQKDSRPRAYRFMPAPVDLTEGAEDMKIVDMSELMDDFESTAAVINSLDLVITVDTAVLHLAGALGRPAWALIPFNTDWRWKITGETTEWYSSVRLFRQPARGDWDSVFNQVLKELQEKLKNERFSER